jgi:hypothetical protein
MSSSNYMAGRKKYQRPQGMLFANNPGKIENGKIIPEGEEFLDFIILSDDNRKPISFKTQRIETKQRMINGRMRSYHIADKLQISTSWDNLPSRSYASSPDFDFTGKSSLNTLSGIRVEQEDGTYATLPKQFFTTDGGAGGVELLNWYENHSGSFWVYLAYDNYDNFASDKYNRLAQYNEVVEVFFSDFSYSVEKRGGSNHDFWNVDLDLEEV